MTRRLEAIWDDGGAAGAVATVQLLRAAPGGSPTLKYELGLLNSTLLSWRKVQPLGVRRLWPCG